MKVKLGKYRLIKQHDKYPKGYTVEAIEQDYDKLVRVYFNLHDTHKVSPRRFDSEDSFYTFEFIGE